MVCEDVLTDPLFVPWRDIASERGIRSLVAVPLLVQEQPVGALLTYAPIPRAYDGDTMNLLSSLGAQAAIAIENADLYHESQRQEEIQKLLKELSQDITSLDLDSLLRKLTEKVREVLKVDISDIRVLENGIWQPLGVSGIEPDHLRGKGTYRGRSHWVVENRRPAMIPDITKGTDFPSGETTSRIGVRGYLGVPLFSKSGEVVGVLRALTYQPKEFTQEEVDLLQQLANGAAVAMENARLFQETEQRATELAIFQPAASTFNQSQDLQVTLNVVWDTVIRSINADAASLRVMNTQGDQIEFAAAKGFPQRHLEERRKGGNLGKVARRVLSTGEVVVSGDIQNDPAFKDGASAHAGFKSAIYAPIIAKDQVLGILHMVSRTPHRFDNRDREILVAIGQQIGAALENVRLFQETERRAQEQAVLNAIATATSQSLDLQQLLRTALDKVLEVTGRERGHIRLKDPVTGDLVLAAYQGILEEFANELLHHRTPGGKSDQVFQSGESLVVNDPEGIRLRENVRREGVQAVAWLPLKARGRVVGILSVATARPIPFAHHEIELLQAIGNVIGVAVENARLFGETQRSLERVRALREIEQGMSSTLDLQTVLDVFLEKMNLLFPYPTVTTVRLFDKEKDWLEPVACRNLDEREWKEKQSTPKGGMAHYVFHNRAPLVIKDLTKEPKVTDESFCRRHRLASYMGVPLMAKGECLGVIGLYTRERHRFADEEVNILLTASSQAALAIQNAQLYSGMKKLADYLAAAIKVKDDFLSVMSHELRTPLNTFVGYTEMVKDEMLGEINQQQQQALEKALNHAGILLDMINRVLLTTQIDAGMVKVESRLVNLGEFLEKLKTTYSVRLAKDVTLLWNYPSNLPLVKTDSHRLKYVLHNLINNGIKFTHKGHVAISAGHIPDARSVELRVRDTGIGIPKEHLSTIFKKFHQVDGSETRLYGGVGLGLYIAKQMTEQLGGTLDVESEPGKGSIFTLKIPCNSR
jgi:GAF domain-containing protein